MNNEEFPKTIREAEFYVTNGYLDEANSCVRVPVGIETKFDPDALVLLARKVERNFPNLKFTGRRDFSDNGDVMFFFK